MTNPSIPSLTFLGTGKMAEAIFSRLISNNLVKPSNLFVSDISKERLDYLKEKYGLNTFNSNSQAIDTSNSPIILAVKPQQIAEVLEEISPVVQDRLVISIAAGIQISKIEKKVPTARIIRVMPNAAALVGEAITAISSGQRVNDSDIKIAKLIFESVGKVIELDESLQNAVTAISGSGPAYFFYLTETLVQAGISIGLTREDSLKLATQTATGAGELLKTGQNPKILRAMVTSSGGTTEAAIRSLEENKLSDIVEKAVQRANKRAVELSEGT